MDVRNAGRWTTPLGLAGALVLILAIEALIAAHPLEVSSPPRFEWQQARAAATTHAPKAAVLALGTSMTKLGLYSPVVERESGRPTLNLAECGGRMQSAFYLLRHALEAGAKPEAILLEVHPIYMTIPFHEGLNAWPDLLDWSDLVDLTQTEFHADFLARTAVATLLPSIRSRHELRDLVLRAFRADVCFNRSANQALVRHFDRNGGSHVNRRETPFAGETHPFIAGMYLPPAWHPEMNNARFLRRILSLCRNRQIPVYWLIPPVAPQLQALRSMQGLEVSYDAFMGRVRAEYPEITVLDTRRSEYPPAAFFDAAHLDYTGAVVFSAEVGRAVRQDLAEHRPRRATAPTINLPMFRSQTSEPPLEDMAWTGRILAEAAASIKR